MHPGIRAQFSVKKTVAAMLVMTIAVFVFLFSVFTPSISFSQTNDTFGLQQIDETVKLTSQDIRVVIAKIIRAALGLLGIVALGLILYAGGTIMLSGGNEEKITQGKKILINAVIGLAIILSAFSITQFVLNKLSDAINQQGNGDDNLDGGKPLFSTFSGTGSLGKIIKDHYPEPNQTDVPRNTKIVVTFAEPIDPGSLIKNTNNSCWTSDSVPTTTVANCKKNDKGDIIQYFGDCLDINNDKVIAWETECDQLATTSVKIFKTDDKNLNPLPVFNSTALAVYDASGQAYTFVFRPLQNLGDSAKNVWHTVDLLPTIKKVSGSNLFAGQFYSHYAWQFETNTTVDFTPPSVISVSPQAGETAPRNKIVRIQFSEAMDPTMAQGILGGNSNFTNIIFNTTTVNGAWKVTNGYTTAEFVSNETCGLNSCGDAMYCLPTGCASDDINCTLNYGALIRTAELFNPNDKTFMALPFTGVVDMAGNALDNGAQNKADNVLANPHKPAVGVSGNAKKIGDQEKAPDNYYWSFVVKNEIDLTSPYIKKVTPGIDAEGVPGNEPVKIYFSKEMWIESLVNGVKIEEYPAKAKSPDGQILDDFPFYHATASVNNETTLTIKHPREFGPNGLDLYYFTSVSSSVRADNQNCLYPGRGPDTDIKGSSPVCNVTYNKNGEYKSSTDCVGVNLDPQTDTGCVTTLESDDKAKPNVPLCINFLKSPEVSPTEQK